ncbi:hypothetical protein EDC04DRAFT_3094977 [Pisolithus marmoratus]|nr:hypothetical protein EDC04DRAFT_3094977 [Pisolithus marmoratus]
MQLLQPLSNSSKRLQNIASAFWQQGVPPGSTLNDMKWPTNIPVAKQLSVSSSTSPDYKCGAKPLNDLFAPSKLARYGLAHPPGTLRDPRRRGRIKTKAKNVSRSETRGSKASGLTITTSPPREIAKPLWNVANTYWRHGVPPGRTCNVNKPLLFETAALQQWYKARGCAHTTRIPEMAVATPRRSKHDHTTLARHTDSRLHCSSYTQFYLNI